MPGGILAQGVNALATCSSQARECERGDEEEEPKAKRRCSLAETVSFDGETPVAGADSGEGSEKEKEELAADAKLRQENGGIQATSEVAKSTNLKRARNVSWEINSSST